MRLIRYELGKLFCQKIFIVILVICAAVNLLLFTFQGNGDSSYTPQMYAVLMDDLAGLSAGEAADILNEKLEDIQDYIFDTNDWSDEDGYCLYTDDIWTEMNLYYDVINEAGQVSGYQDYLAQVQTNASNMVAVSIFGSSSGFSLKNIEKTVADFSGLSDIEPIFDISQGVISATGEYGTDLIMAVLLAALCVFLIFGEKQNGLLMLISPTNNGHRQTTAAKLAAMVTLTAVFGGIIYGEDFALAGRQYGFGDLTRPIQSVYGYKSCALHLSVMGYFVLFFIIKLLLCLMLGLIFFLICLAGKSMLQFIAACVIAYGGSAALYLLIPENSRFMALKYLNLISFLHTDQMIASYENLNLFGRPASFMASALILMIMAVLALIIVSIYISGGSRYMQSSGNLEIRLFRKTKGRVRSIAGFEYLKLVKKTGVIWVLILFAVIQIYRICDYDYFSQADEVYYKSYMDYLSGPVTDETADYVEKENARYEELYEDYYSTDDLSEQSDIWQQLLPEKAWEMVAEEYDRIISEKEMIESSAGSNITDGGNGEVEQTGKALCMVYPSGYNELMGQNEQRDMINALLFGILLCVCLSSVFAGDAGCGMDKLIATTRGGGKDTLLAKRKVSFISALVIFLLVYGGDFLMILIKIGLNQWQAPLASLEIFDGCSPAVKIWQYMVILYAIKFVGMWVCLAVIRLLSRFCRDTFRTMLISAIVFVLPPLLGLMQVAAVKHISLVPLLTGSGILNKIILLGI
ncbi:MAG: hypothetical protein LUC41_05255 [Clostridiales bacterium]|nr:hypothetical protein [Clostridiales bacterium]